MRIINEPIKVMTIFDKDGTMKPVKFRYDDQVIRIEKIIRCYDEPFCGNNVIVFVCQHGDKGMYELKYEQRTRKWFLSIN